MYSEEIKKLMSEVDIVDIINTYNIPTKAQGNVYVGKCPFCKKNVNEFSMMINQAEQRYRCFKCGSQGNVFIFVRDYEDISFGEAVKVVREKKILIEQKKLEKKK